MNKILTPGFAMNQKLPQYDEFRATYPYQIARNIAIQRVHLNKADWFLVTCIQYAINNCCRYRKEYKDYWRIMLSLADEGDCEDIVFTKRFLLHKAGFSLNAFVPVICEYNGKGHMILCIRTDEGDFIADNIIKDIRKLEDINYKMQYMLISNTWRMVL